jgi:hypothetical protein
MKVIKISTERVYNLGNYESIRFGIEADLEETDNIKESYNFLSDLLDEQFNDYKKSSKNLVNTKKEK